MTISLTFHDLEAAEALALMLFHSSTSEKPKSSRRTSTSKTSSEPSKEPKSRSTRRSTTKSTDDTAPEPEAKTSRRGKSAPSTDAPAPRGARGRRKAAAKSPSKEIKDVELVKAASTLAEATNPSVVMSILEEFGVSSCEKIPQDQRREFLTRMEEATNE